MCDECGASLEIYEKLEPIIPLLQEMMQNDQKMYEERGYKNI